MVAVAKNIKSLNKGMCMPATVLFGPTILMFLSFSELAPILLKFGAGKKKKNVHWAGHDG
jgi:hypothetical protein